MVVTTENCLQVLMRTGYPYSRPSAWQAGVLEKHSISPCLSWVILPGTAKGRFTAQLITLMRRLREPSRTHKSAWRGRKKGTTTRGGLGGGWEGTIHGAGCPGTVQRCPTSLLREHQGMMSRAESGFATHRCVPCPLPAAWGPCCWTCSRVSGQGFVSKASGRAGIPIQTQCPFSS